MEDSAEETNRLVSSADPDEVESAQAVATENKNSKDVPKLTDSNCAGDGGSSGLIKRIISHLPLRLPPLPEKPAQLSAGELGTSNEEAEEKPALEVKEKPERIHTQPATPPDDFSLDTEEATILISIIHD